MREYETTWDGLPETVEAAELTKDNADELAELCGGIKIEERDALHPDVVYVGVNVPTGNGVRRLSEGGVLIHRAGQWFILSRHSFRNMYKKKEN